MARVVGMSNLIEGEVVRGATRAEEGGCAGGLAQVAVGARHRISVDTRLAPGTPVWAGLRPERLKVDVGRGEGLPIGKGVVRTIVADGVAATVSLEWAGLELRTHLLAGRGLARTIAPGDSVTLSVRPEDVHLIPRG